MRPDAQRSHQEEHGINRQGLASPNDKGAAVFKRDNLQENVAHPCGSFKCLFPLKESSSESAHNTKKTGFLVSKFRPLYLTQAQMAWNLTQTLATNNDTYDVAHIYVGAPQQVWMEDEDIDIDEGDGDEEDIHTHEGDGNEELSLGEWLDLNTTRSVGDAAAKGIPRFQNYTSLLVQEVEILDLEKESALFFGCTDNKITEGGWNNVENKLLNPLLSKTEADRHHVHKQLQKQISSLRRLLVDYPCLYNDFQIFLRGNGRFLHMDMDRCFYGKRFVIPPKAERFKCQLRIDDLTEFILKTLETGAIPSTRPQYVSTATT
jgi:hypothetical protein